MALLLMPIVRLVLCVVCWLAWPLSIGAAPAVTQPRTVGNSFVRVEGITTVHSIAQSDDGWLWVGGPQGLSRCDGITLTSISGPWADAQVRQLVVTEGHDLWVVTGNARLEGKEPSQIEIIWGVEKNQLWHARLRQGQPGTWQQLDVAQEPVFAIAASGAGVVSIATPTRIVFAAPPGRSHKVPEAIAHPGITALAFAEDQTLWFADNRAFYKRGADETRPILLGEVGATAIMPMGSAALIAGFNGVAQWPSGKKLSEAPCTDLGHDAERFWFAGPSGIRIAPLQSPEQSEPVLAGKVVETMFSDREGTMWIGTSGTGLFRSDPSLVEVPAVGDGTQVGIFSVLWSHNNRLWVTSTGGVDVLDHHGVVQKHFSLLDMDVWSPRGVAETTDNKILIAADAFGLLYGDEAGLTTHKILRNNVQVASPAVFTLSRGRVGIAFDDHGLRLASAESFRPDAMAFGAGVDIDTNNGLCPGPIVAATYDKAGTIWTVHGQGGLSSISDSGITCVSNVHPLPANDPVSLAADRDGRVWIGFATPVGLGLVQDGRIRIIPQTAGLAVSSIFGIAFDEADRIWLTSNRGVVVAKREDLLAYTQGRKQWIAAFRVGVSLGLPTEDCMARFSPSIAILADGRAAVPTLSGLALVSRPTQRKRANITTFIENIRIRGKDVVPQENLTLSDADLPIELAFTAPTSVHPEHVRFQYQNLRLSNQWQPVDHGRNIHIVSLDPGKHVFHVRATNETGDFEGSAVQLVLNVTPPWWRHPITALVGVLLALGLVMLIYRIRWQQMRLRDQAVNIERQRLARELHDGLAQGFCAIEIHLTAISRQADAAAPQLIPWLRQTQDVVRQCTSQARDAIWNLRTLGANMSLTDAIRAAAERAGGSKGRVAITIEGQRPTASPEMLHELPLVAQEAVANAVNHGKAAKVNITLTTTAAALSMRVVDDGHGFEPGAPPKDHRHGFGILGMKERLARIGGTLEIHSQPGQGTRVEVVVPADHSRGAT